MPGLRPGLRLDDSGSFFTLNWWAEKHRGWNPSTKKNIHFSRKKYPTVQPDNVVRFHLRSNLLLISINNPVALKKTCNWKSLCFGPGPQQKNKKTWAPPAPLAFNFQVEMLLGFIIGIQAFDSIRASKLGTGSLEPRKKQTYYIPLYSIQETRNLAI